MVDWLFFLTQNLELKTKHYLIFPLTSYQARFESKFVNNKDLTPTLFCIVEVITESYYGAGTPSQVKLSNKEKDKVMKIVKELSNKLSIDSTKIEVLEEEQ